MRALIFDLDGTLVDTVYAHVFAWQQALAEAGMAIPGWLIHRRIGMSGGLFTRAVARELGRDLSAEEVQALQRRHGELFGHSCPREGSHRRPAETHRAYRFLLTWDKWQIILFGKLFFITLLTWFHKEWLGNKPVSTRCWKR
jgi:hypothetical protein